jgi:hypothetical protein
MIISIFIEIILFGDLFCHEIMKYLVPNDLYHLLILRK